MLNFKASQQFNWLKVCFVLIVALIYVVVVLKYWMSTTLERCGVSLCLQYAPRAIVAGWPDWLFGLRSAASSWMSPSPLSIHQYQLIHIHWAIQSTNWYWKEMTLCSASVLIQMASTNPEESFYCPTPYFYQINLYLSWLPIQFHMCIQQCNYHWRFFIRCSL